MGQKEEDGPWLHLGGAPGGGQPTRAHQGAQALPGGVVARGVQPRSQPKGAGRRLGACAPPRVPPGPPLCSINTPIFQKP